MPMERPDVVRALESEIAELRAANASLTARLARLESALVPAAAAPATPPEPAGETRRGMLKLLAGAAGGAVVATVAHAGPAAAIDGDPLVMGGTTTADSRPTRAVYTGGDSGGVAFLFQAAGTVDPDAGVGSTFDGALGGWVGEGSNLTTGVYGYSSQAGGSGVLAFGGASDGVGLRARGGRAALLLMGAGHSAPPEDTTTHEAGEIQADGNGDVWVCVAGGSPGDWRKLAGPATGGAFHPINPIRVYDSRLGTYTPSGRLEPNEHVVVSVADAHGATGTVTTADAVPSGAIAVAYNLTVTRPNGGNFLSIAPGDATGFTASAINFNGSTDVANGGIVRLDRDRQVRIFCGDQQGSTHVIVDVTGYFR